MTHALKEPNYSNGKPYRPCAQKEAAKQSAYIRKPLDGVKKDKRGRPYKFGSWHCPFVPVSYHKQAEQPKLAKAKKRITTFKVERANEAERVLVHTNIRGEGFTSHVARSPFHDCVRVVKWHKGERIKPKVDNTYDDYLALQTGSY